MKPSTATIARRTAEAKKAAFLKLNPGCEVLAGHATGTLAGTRTGRQVEANPDAASAAEAILSALQIVDKGALLDAIATGLNLADLVRSELASRGLDDNGQWVGFERAEASWKARIA